MKITRHTAKDMRQALRLVRDQLGADAVILTSKRTPFGVEVTAAIDFDASQIEAQAPAAEPRTFRPEEFAPPAPAPQPAAPRREDPYTIADSYAQAEEDVQQSLYARIQAEMLEAKPVATKAAATIARNRTSEVKAAPPPAPTRAVEERGSAPRAAAMEQHASALSRPATEGQARRTTAVVQQPLPNDDVQSALESAIDAYMTGGGGAEDDEALLTATVAVASRDGSGDDSAMSSELKAMRRLLETQMAQLAWNDLTRRAPIHTEILTGLTEMGLTQDFASHIVAQLPPGMDLTRARRLSIALVSQRLAVTGDRWLDKGGRVALIGPTGVGKTTTLAKLAVRWVLRHGSRSLALISADSVRIGAHDQMQALGQLLDAPVYVAEDFGEIPGMLERLGAQRFVLIDTPGMGQRDAQLPTRLGQLSAAGQGGGAGLETALVLSASTQAGAIEETIKRYAAAKPASVLLTKVDEAASLGGVLSLLSGSELPISYVSEGQRVPEDLRPARALELVSRAVQLAKASGAAADEDLLRRRYGDVAHALA